MMKEGYVKKWQGCKQVKFLSGRRLMREAKSIGASQGLPISTELLQVINLSPLAPIFLDIKSARNVAEMQEQQENHNEWKFSWDIK